MDKIAIQERIASDVPHGRRTDARAVIKYMTRTGTLKRVPDLANTVVQSASKDDLELFHATLDACYHLADQIEWMNSRRGRTILSIQEKLARINSHKSILTLEDAYHQSEDGEIMPVRVKLLNMIPTTHLKDATGFFESKARDIIEKAFGD